MYNFECKFQFTTKNYKTIKTILNISSLVYLLPILLHILRNIYHCQSIRSNTTFHHFSFYFLLPYYSQFFETSVNIYRLFNLQLKIFICYYPIQLLSLHYWFYYSTICLIIALLFFETSVTIHLINLQLNLAYLSLPSTVIFLSKICQF